MALLSKLTQKGRSPGDPRIIEAGPSVRPAADEMARALGWFSMALGAAELAAPHALARWLGMEGREGVIRAFGAREIAAGMTALSTERPVGLWSRVGGDLMDFATLLSAYRADNPKRHNVGLALSAAAAITLIDLACAKASRVTHARGKGPWRDYRDRSGFPGGVEAARGRWRRDSTDA